MLRPYLGGGLIQDLCRIADRAQDPVVRSAALMAAAKVASHVKLAVDRSQFAATIEKCWGEHDDHVHITTSLAAGLLVAVLQGGGPGTPDLAGLAGAERPESLGPRLVPDRLVPPGPDPSRICRR